MLCCVFFVFQKHLTVWNVRATRALRNMQYLFCFMRWSEVFLPFQRVGKSISMLANLTGRLTFLRSMHGRIRISRSVKGGINLTPKLKASDFRNFSFERLDFCIVPLVLSNVPLLSTVSGTLMEEWDGEAECWFGLSGRNNGQITSWQRRFWMWNLNVDLCISRSSFHHVTAESKTSMDFTWCFRSFGEARFFGTVPHAIPDAKNTQPIWNCLGFISMWGQTTQEQARSLEDRMPGHRVNWNPESKKLLWLLSYYRVDTFQAVGSQLHRHLNHAQLQVTQGANEPAGKKFFSPGSFESCWLGRPVLWTVCLQVF